MAPSAYKYRKVRAKWLEELLVARRMMCWICKHRPGTDVEHMMHGRARSKVAVLDTATFCWLCHQCHMNLEDVLEPFLPPEETISDKLARRRLCALLSLKKRNDPSHYDRSKVLRLYGYSDRFISDDDVASCACDRSRD